MGGNLTNDILLEQGVPQGDVISPYLLFSSTEGRKMNTKVGLHHLPTHPPPPPQKKNHLKFLFTKLYFSLKFIKDKKNWFNKISIFYSISPPTPKIQIFFFFLSHLIKMGIKWLTIFSICFTCLIFFFFFSQIQSGRKICTQ